MDLTETETARRSPRLRQAAGLALALVAAGLAALWIERRQLASDLLDRRLARAGVSAAYRIVTLGPGVQVVEGVRLGDVAHPDLTADRLTLRWRYRLGWPTIAAVELDGVHLNARWQDGRLSLGSVDRLLPTGGKGGGLPDLRVRLHGAVVALQTAAGPATIRIEGAGNPARAFSGTAAIEAGPLAAGACRLTQLRLHLAVRVRNAIPHVEGPASLGPSSCGGLRLSGGSAIVQTRSSAALSRFAGEVRLSGFAGRLDTLRFAPITATVRLADSDPLRGTLALRVGALSAGKLHAASARLAGRFARTSAATSFYGDLAASGATLDGGLAQARAVDRSAAGSPLAPLAERLAQSLARLSAGSDLAAPVDVTAGRALAVAIDGATLRPRSGAPLRLDGRFDRAGGASQLRVAIAGADLPTATIAATAIDAGELHGRVSLAPYTAAGARLVLAPVRLDRSGDVWRFATAATLDGPLGDGRVEGLNVPLDGRWSRTDGLTLDAGCRTMGLTQLRAGGLRLTPARLRLCGAPLVAIGHDGRVRIDASARDLVLRGTSGAAPAMLQLRRVHLSATRFAAEGLAIRLGGEPEPTRLDIATLGGTIGQRMAGRFSDAAGAIGRVPLAISGADGSWSLANGRLHLGGELLVSDRAAAARFLPLASRDIALDLANGRIDATATLRTPHGDAPVTRVRLTHDLASGVGGAALGVPGLTFVRGGLQPEMLTPLTLGVIANVSGTLTGSGRIDWTLAGTTSSGRFATERLDLAAAFGPVTGLAGTLVFTDLLGLVSAPHQEARIAEINPGVAVTEGIAHYQLVGDNRVQVEEAHWPFAGGTLTLDPALLDFGQPVERRLTFRITALDAARFIQQLDFPNISATGTFDGRLPMIFGEQGGRIEDGYLRARGPGALAYVGELSQAQLGTMGKLAFDALKAIRYSGLDIALAGNLDGEIVTRVRFDGVARATSGGIVGRILRRLPFRFNIGIRAPFRGLVGSAQSYANPALLLKSAPVQPADNPDVRQEVRP